MWHPPLGEWLYPKSEQVVFWAGGSHIFVCVISGITVVIYISCLFVGLKRCDHALGCELLFMRYRELHSVIMYIRLLLRWAINQPVPLLSCESMGMNNVFSTVFVSVFGYHVQCLTLLFIGTC